MSYELRWPFDSWNGSCGQAVVEGEEEDPARDTGEASLSSLDSEKRHNSSIACPFVQSVDNI